MQRFNISTASYETSFIYLDSLRQIEPAFVHLREALFLFNEKYVILPNYVDNAVEKLRQFRTKFLQESYKLLNKNSEDRDIELASEIYVTGNTYPKVWPVIVQCNEHKDEMLIENIRKREFKQQQASPSGVRVTANQDALNELKKLSDLKSSYEKAQCVHTALDLTVAAKTLRIVDRKNSTVTYHSTPDSTVMAADETLTAFIDLLCQFTSLSTANEQRHLVAQAHYVDTFKFISLPQEVDYAFTTYRIALEYLASGTTFI